MFTEGNLALWCSCAFSGKAMLMSEWVTEQNENLGKPESTWIIKQDCIQTSTHRVIRTDVIIKYYK